MMRTIVNTVVLNKRIDRLVALVKIGMGTSSTISMSNTIKMIARRKKRMENGIRALWLGSNPHSNADDFSRFVVDRIEVIHAIVNTRAGKIIATVEDVSRRVIN